MNLNLLEHSIKYHGKKLSDLIKHKCPDFIENDQVLNQNSNDEFDTNEKELQSRLFNFISSKSDILFNESNFPSKSESSHNDVIVLDNEETPKDDLLNQKPDSGINEFDIPPLETFMEIDPNIRKEHLFDYVKRGDIVIGCVVDKNSRGILLNMVCFDGEKRRDISNFKFNLIFPYENLRNNNSKFNKSKYGQDKSDSHFSRNDFLRCIIVNIDKQNDVCEVSIEWNDEFKQIKSIKLGLIEPESLPEYYKNIQDYLMEPFTFGKSLKYQRGFNNPAFVKIFCKKLSINTNQKFSLMDSLNRLEINKEEMADELLKTQNKNLALEHVQRGVSLVKEGKNQDAILNYQKALQIDGNCVEAFVARGALYGNEGEYIKSIENFEKGLKIDANNSNAKKYLKEVFLAYSIKLEKSDNLKEAKTNLRKALDLDPENEVIRSKYNELNKKIESSFTKNRYGPSLPSGSGPLRARKRSSSRDSNSPPKEKLSKVNNDKRSSNYNIQNKYEYKRHDTSNYSKQSNSRRSDIKHDKEKGKNSDDEDLEAFYNQLKQKKETMRKNK